VLGQLLAVNADLIASGVAAGHTMGNHTFDHVTLSDIGREEFIQQIVRTQKLLAEAGTNCMRPPYGATDAFTLAYAEELGFRVVMWDVDTRDWSLPGAQAIVDETLAGVRPGAIILMHDGGGDRQQTVAALDLVLPRLKEMGYRFETYCTK
jgi:peptidoglycan/xylan/chitin deacetylase (PgdA/CDA1 family)